MKQLLLCFIALFTLLTAGGLRSTVSAAEISLPPREASMVSISALAAQGDLPWLKAAMAEGLDAGLTVNEEKELMIQLYAYAGFPRSLNGVNTLLSLVEEKRAAGETVNMGRDATPLDPKRDRQAIGKANQTALVGRPVTSKTYDFAPVANEFFQSHLFGDIFERDLLTWKEREIATISMLAGIGNVNAQLGSHMRAGMHNGITSEELAAIVRTLSEKVSPETGANAREVMETVLKK